MSAGLTGRHRAHTTLPSPRHSCRTLGIPRSLFWAVCLTVGGVPLVTGAASATIDTDVLQRPWPKQWVRDIEVGRYQVRWRQLASRKEGVFAGVRFTAPLDRQALWPKTSDFTAIGRMTPGVTAVRFLEQEPHRSVIQLDIQVLWKTILLTFEIEEDPPRAMRFRLVNETLGEYRGVCWMEDPPAMPGASMATGTIVELATWFKPARPIPTGLVLLIERMTFLQGVKEFLESCEQPPVKPQEVK